MHVNDSFKIERGSPMGIPDIVFYIVQYEGTACKLRMLPPQSLGVPMHDIVCTWGIGQFTNLLEGRHSQGGCVEMYNECKEQTEPKINETQDSLSLKKAVYE